MLDQSFSPDNFRRIFDLENRRGNYLEGRFFPRVEAITKEIKEKRTELRKLKAERKKVEPEAFKIKLAELYKELDELEEKWEQQLGHELENVCSDIAIGRYEIRLNASVGPDGKATYTLDDTAHAFFVVKQVQANLRSLYLVKQSSRYDILCQLRSLLSDDFPKRILRTDIQDFYESIPVQRLIDKLDSESLVSVSSRTVVKYILHRYRELSGKAVGVPRGVGISAYLAELFIREFDSVARSLQGVRYFARYVDDIVVVQELFDKEDKSSSINLLEQAAKALFLNLNHAKTVAIDIPVELGASFEYLGYKIFPHVSETKFQFTDKKMQRYRKRIDAVFDRYDAVAKLDEKRARKLLMKRVLFLTGNTRLRNNKKALVGIYFSNRLLNTTKCLTDLDGYLKKRIAKVSSMPLRMRLQRLSFREGFEQRRFTIFSTEMLGRIVDAWRHVS